MKKHILTQPNAKTEEFLNYEFITYESADFYFLAIFKGRRSKPQTHYRFKTEVRRYDYLKDQKNYFQFLEDRDKKELEKNLKEAEKYKEGVILYSSWGYDQTNIDFYKIIARKNKTLTIQPIKGDYNRTQWDGGTCTPVDTPAGEPFTKRIGKSGYISLNSYAGLSLYEHPLSWSDGH